MTPTFWFVFDVESMGLHGDGFAVGWVVIDATTGKEVERGGAYCPQCEAETHTWEEVGEVPQTSRKWIEENVPYLAFPHLEYATPSDVREVFWGEWQDWKSRGAVMAADVAWPVEARFLNECIDDEPGREWEGPYPLIDIASVRLAAGLDPLATEPRRENEMPAHDPLADARQSARLLMEALAPRTIY